MLPEKPGVGDCRHVCGHPLCKQLRRLPAKGFPSWRSGPSRLLSRRVLTRVGRRPRSLRIDVGKWRILPRQPFGAVGGSVTLGIVRWRFDRKTLAVERSLQREFRGFVSVDIHLPDNLHGDVAEVLGLRAADIRKLNGPELMMPPAPRLRHIPQEEAGLCPSRKLGERRPNRGSLKSY
jgi:hypothetical protein